MNGTEEASVFCGECGQALVKQYPPNYFNTSGMDWWCPKCNKYPSNIMHVKAGRMGDMKASCECVSQVNKQLKEKLNDTAHVLYDMVSGCVKISFYFNTFEGKKMSKEKEGYVKPSYCPFCGKAYID